MAQNMVLTFAVYRGDKLLQTVDYSNESVTIGSGAAALLSLPGSGLAELHAVLNVQEDGLVQILDLGSDVGTMVNGKSITADMLRSGDVLDMGKVRLVVTWDATEPLGVPAPAATPKPDPAEETVLDGGGMSTMEDEVTDAGTGGLDGTLVDDDFDEEYDPDAPENQTEDVMAFIMRSGTSQTEVGIDRKRPKVLEVNQIWGELLLDTKHYPQRGKPITIGSSVGWKWNLLGIDMGWVPVGLHLLLPYAPPMWSEVVSDWRNDFYAPDTNLPSGRDHKLISWHKSEGYVADIPEEWDGFVDIGDKRYTFDELVSEGKAKKAGKAYEIPIEDDFRLMVDVDGVIFFSHMVHPGQRVISRMSESIDYPFIGIFTFMAFIGLMFGILMATLPPPPKNEMIEIPDRFVDLILQTPEKQDIEKKPDSNPDAGEGAKAKREEGKVGKKDAKMERAKGNKVQLGKQQADRQIAENAGVLGAMRPGSELDGVFGSSGLSSDITGGIGGLIGAKGVQIGSGGLGSRGSGLGGGGTAEGLGGLGTKGIGSGASGYGAGGGHFGAKGEGALTAVGGDPIILGALDRSLIDEVIKRHMNQIRYCYQRELTKDHNLAGKIVVKFVIAKDGSVSSASIKNSTMGNAGVEQCIVGRFMRMQFPKPKGGGIVIVSYPFFFSPG